MLRFLTRLYVKLVSNYKFSKVNRGESTHIGIKTSMMHPENIYLGDRSGIHSGQLVAGEHSKIVIGKDCLISYNVHIRTVSHHFKDRDTIIFNQGEYEKDIVIGDDCWVGFGAQIMCGVTLGQGSVIGAGAIVTKSTEPYGVYVGVPARKISERTSAQQAAKEEVKEW